MLSARKHQINQENIDQLLATLEDLETADADQARELLASGARDPVKWGDTEAVLLSVAVSLAATVDDLSARVATLEA